MRLRTRGLLVDGIDRELYVARPELEHALLDPVLSGGNVLVIGGPGAGKTTSLRRLADDLRRRGQPAVFINGMAMATTDELLRTIAQELESPYATGPERSVTAALRLLAQSPATCILVDGPVSDETARELFARHRDEVWSSEHRWVLTGTPGAVRSLLVPPADAFWDRVVEIPALTSSEVEDLLRRGLDPDELEDLADIWAPPDPAWPRPTVRSVREALDGTSLAPPAWRQQLEVSRARLGRTPAMVLAELEGLRRPAAASDAELLDRLGYTRAYVARALSELEEGGLVTSMPDPDASGRPGRPSKLYSPVLRT